LQFHILDAWTHWKSVHTSEFYSSLAEESFRLNNFSVNYEIVSSSNSNTAHTFKLALNKFADLSVEEFIATYLQTKDFLKDSNSFQTTNTDMNDNVADSIDWTTQGAVTGVKDQGQCGSCWAFSTTGALEAVDFLKNGKLQSFSEQQLVDCDVGSFYPFEMSNLGCSGGNMGWAFKYSSDRGMMSESDYPYEAVNGKCRFDSSKTVFKNASYYHVLPLCNSCLKSRAS